MKITPREKRRHSAGREKNEGPSFFSLPAACRLFSRGVIFTRARVSLALLSLRKNGGLLVVYVIMCREVLVSELSNFKPRSPERGKVWEAIAQRLNAINQPKFRVSARAVRDRYSLLTAKQAQKLRDEEKASGIHVKITELDSLLEDTVI